MFTAQLGTALAEPGNILLGQQPVLTSLVATWHGPFFPADLYDGSLYAERIQNGQEVIVPAATASQLFLSDPTWWSFG